MLAGGGYKTAHFGKWHNGRTLGYEPWEMGFQESWLPTSHVHLDNLMRCGSCVVCWGAAARQGLTPRPSARVRGVSRVHVAPIIIRWL